MLVVGQVEVELVLRRVGRLEVVLVVVAWRGGCSPGLCVFWGCGCGEDAGVLEVKVVVVGWHGFGWKVEGWWYFWQGFWVSAFVLEPAWVVGLECAEVSRGILGSRHGVPTCSWDTSPW